MDPRELEKDRSTIADIVTAENVDTVNSGIVKDDEAQSLSTLASREDALGTRRPKEGAKGIGKASRPLRGNERRCARVRRSREAKGHAQDAEVASMKESERLHGQMLRPGGEVMRKRDTRNGGSRSSLRMSD